MMRSFFSTTFTVAGVLTLILAVFAAIASANSLAERMRFGSGVMFADVELFAMLALCLLVVGAGLLWLGKRLNRKKGVDESP
jgi:preprotein translocase subunit SecY